MTDAELDRLDRLAAERIICDGGKYRLLPEGICFKAENSHDWIIKHHIGAWKPTRRIEQAWELLEKMGQKQIDISYSSLLKTWLCVIQSSEGSRSSEDPTAPLAITLACLKSRSVSPDDEERK